MLDIYDFHKSEHGPPKFFFLCHAILLISHLCAGYLMVLFVTIAQIFSEID